MKIKIGSILLIFFILLTGCAFPTNGQSPIVPVSGALTVTQVIDKSAAAQSIGQNGQNSQVETCRPDLTQAAAALNITADQLQAALGRPIEGKPDMTAAASKLGVSVDALQTAMRGALPSNCSAPGADKQPASSAAATSPKSQSGQSDQAAACRPDMTRVAATLHITSDQLQSALGSAGQSQPDLTAAATKLGISADTLQTAMQQSIASSCPTKTTANKTEPGPGTFTMDQTLSDKAQEMTIAFDGLAFLTGNLGSDSFFPPGKVADFWGFQYLRDNDPSEMGHNTDFLTRASLNMFTILTAGQKAQLIALAKKQVSSINEYGAKRFVLMTAFRRLLTGDLPAGTTGLNEDAVKTFSAELYQLDGQMSYERAQVMGSILHDLNDSQKAYLAKMVGKGMTSWLDVPEPVELRPTTGDEKIAVMSYAGDLFSWYAGSVDADVYFCPERQGTYFGSFYMKDAPAVGNPGYSIGTNITADMGDAFVAALNPDQAKLITSLVDIQRPSLMEIVDVRKQVSIELRKYIAGESTDSATVQSLMTKYGQLDGAIVYNIATHFSKVGQTLTAEQKAKLMALRKQTLGSFTPKAAFLYATPIDFPQVQNTDFLFK